MLKFEYKTIKIKAEQGIFKVSIDQENLDKLLNKYGAEGWEFPPSTPLSNNGITYRIYFTFKRHV
ncbi:DUF4177 domain-containing protein [Empedobacter brevis]|uniref:DUF4177 domain-containing protein n=1 Tax=Empedobacter brevis TaxID=247 RepID=UPI0033410F77